MSAPQPSTVLGADGNRRPGQSYDDPEPVRGRLVTRHMDCACPLCHSTRALPGRCPSCCWHQPTQGHHPHCTHKENL